MKETRHGGYIAPDIKLIRCSSKAIVCASLEQVSEVEYDFDWE